MSIFTRGISNYTVGRYPQFNNYVSPLSQLYGQTSMTSAAGERIDEWTALGVSSVLGAVSLLADSVASMPLRCFSIDKTGTRVLRPLPDVLANPDPESNTYELIHQIVASLALHGNAYVKIDRDRSGTMIGLVPLHPYQMQVLPTGDQTGRMYLHLGNQIDREDMLHLRWFTPPQSLVGISPLNQTRNLVGLSIAMDRHLAQFYGEGGTPSSVLETDQKLTLDQARIFRIPSHLIGASGDNQTYQNVEQASLNFLTHTIHPWLRRIEIALSRILDVGDDVAFDTSVLLRVDALTRAKVNEINVKMGARTPNEVRQIEGLEPAPGLDDFHQALQGNVTAGGDLPALGTDIDPSAPTMGVLE